jgi:hypothetical protein
LNVGLTRDDLDQNVAGSHPELIDGVGFARGFRIVGFFDTYGEYVQCHGEIPLTQNNEVRPKLSTVTPIRGRF